MPKVLITYDVCRQIYDVPDTPTTWVKVYEIAVGLALSVHVFFQFDTQEIHVKTFKFQTLKTRRVAITVAADASNTVTAKLVTLHNNVITNTAGFYDEVIATLDLYGRVVAYMRNSDREIYPAVSNTGATAAQFNESAAAAAKILPPSQISAIYIMPYAGNYNYGIRRRMIQALESVGYSNIGCIEQRSPLLTSALKMAKPDKKVGELVGISEVGVVNVVRKTDNGYDYVELVVNLKRLYRFFPSIKEIICYSIGDVPDDNRKLLQQKYHPLSVKFVTIGSLFFVPYMWNKHDKGNMDGCLVTMTVQCKFRIYYNRKNTVIDARTELFPWQKSILLNVGNAKTLDIFMLHDNRLVRGEDHIQQFKFPSKQNRKVSVSIFIDDSRCPKVNLLLL